MTKTSIEQFSNFVEHALSVQAARFSQEAMIQFKIEETQARIVQLTAQSMSDEEIALFLTEYGHSAENQNSLSAVLASNQSKFSSDKFKFMLELAGLNYSEWEQAGCDYAQAWDFIEKVGITRQMSAKASEQFYTALTEGMTGLIDFVQEVQKEQSSRKQKIKDSIITVNGVPYSTVTSCEVLWSGWEMDNKAWVVRHEEGLKLVASSHGTAYFESPSFLEQKIAYYEQAIAQSKSALALLNNQ